MRDVLLGRTKPPIDTGVTTLMECAEAYHARAMDISINIHRAEVQGQIPKGSNQYKFRTGELRDFAELCKRAMDMGSRRVTALQIELEERG